MEATAIVIVSRWNDMHEMKVHKLLYFKVDILWMGLKPKQNTI